LALHRRDSRHRSGAMGRDRAALQSLWFRSRLSAANQTRNGDCRPPFRSAGPCMIATRKTEEAERVEALEAERAGNLRQLLLGASRSLNRLVVEALQKRGHKKFRSTHLSLTSNIDLHGTRLNVLAARAN